MMTELERLRLRSTKSLFDVIRLVDQLGPDAFDPLLDRFEAEAHLRSTDFFTPKEVASLMASLTAGEASMGHPVYDPYLRGGELLSAAHSVPYDPKPQLVVGESPNQDTLRLAGMNLVLHGLAAELRLGTGTPWDDLDERRPPAGSVVLNPPFNARGASTRLRPDSEWPFGPPPSRNDNYAWIQYAITSLAPGGTAAVLMPNRAGVSTNEREYAIRGKMVEQGAVQAVVALPSLLFPSTEIGATLWVLTRPSDAPGQVLFVDARTMSRKTGTRQVLAPDAADLICGLYRRRQLLTEGNLEFVPDGALAVFVGIDALRRANYSLSPADYTAGSIKPRPDPSAARVVENLRELANMKSRVNQADSRTDALQLHPRGAVTGDIPPGWNRRPLADLCDIQAGPSYSRLGVEERARSGTVPIVMPRHLRNRRVIAPDADRIPEEVAWHLAKFRLAANDILCIRSGAMGEPALIDDRQKGWLFGTNLLRLRVGNLAVADPRYMLGYLSLPAVMRWIRDRSRGTAAPSISSKSLGDLMVALPPLAEQRDIGSALSVLGQQIAAHREFAQAAERVRAELAEHLMGGALILR
jgi:type I restriction enzyme M protein